MKILKKVLPIIILPFLFTACSVTSKNTLSDEKKLEIYHKVMNEIKNYKKQGDIYLKKKYYYKAILSYEKVNFYEKEEVYSKKYINSLKNRAKFNANYFFKKAKAQLKRNKLKSLYYINLTMRNNPFLPEAIKLKETLLNDEKVKVFISKEEKELQKLLQKSKINVYHTLALDNAIKKLNRYDENNPFALQAKNKIKDSYEELLTNSIKLYDKKQYDKAKKEFRILSSIYQEDYKIDNYLHNIKHKELIEEAKDYLAKKEYLKAQEIASNVLKSNKYNKEAKEILEASTLAKCDLTGKLASKGIRLYLNQNFDDAKKIFEKIIACEPDNQRAYAYLKKINQQLNTIKKLR
ncbi:MAG: hypothetical protein HWD90_05145 [Campylobacteraceae bacterium]|nr:hypothetical protein [Campylobacteraceae bacterium]